jgi:hypothetical protein
MQWVEPRTIGWAQPNPVCNVTKKMSKAFQNNEMIQCGKSLALRFKHAHDFNQKLQRFKIMFKMMVEKLFSCNFSNMLFEGDLFIYLKFVQRGGCKAFLCHFQMCLEWKKP